MTIRRLEEGEDEDLVREANSGHWVLLIQALTVDEHRIGIRVNGGSRIHTVVIVAL